MSIMPSFIIHVVCAWCSTMRPFLRVQTSGGEEGRWRMKVGALTNYLCNCWCYSECSCLSAYFCFVWRRTSTLSVHQVRVYSAGAQWLDLRSHLKWAEEAGPKELYERRCLGEGSAFLKWVILVGSVQCDDMKRTYIFDNVFCMS